MQAVPGTSSQASLFAVVPVSTAFGLPWYVHGFCYRPRWFPERSSALGLVTASILVRLKIRSLV